jgi:hypothetical protein
MSLRVGGSGWRGRTRAGDIAGSRASCSNSAIASAPRRSARSCAAAGSHGTSVEDRHQLAPVPPLPSSTASPTGRGVIDACYLQEVHDVRRQVGENLPDEVIGNATLVAGEVREEPFDVGRRRQGPRCEAQPCGLAVGMAVQPLGLRRTRARASHPDLSASSTARPHFSLHQRLPPQAGLPEPPARLCGRCDATGSASSSTSPAIAADQPARSPAAPVGPRAPGKPVMAGAHSPPAMAGTPALGQVDTHAWRSGRR